MRARRSLSVGGVNSELSIVNSERAQRDLPTEHEYIQNIKTLACINYYLRPDEPFGRVFSISYHLLQLFLHIPHNF
jgi:hypothetical protein